MSDKNISPVGWYVGSYLMRFIELEEENNYDLEARFTAWENTVIVQASNLDEAYDKIVQIGISESEPYKGGPEGIPVKWVFEGITELLPIYEELEDGSEIMWREHNPKKLKNLKKCIREKYEFKQ
jgi:hypothetical protein